VIITFYCWRIGYNRIAIEANAVMKIFNVKIDKYTKAQLEGLISEAFKKSHKIKISKINTEFLQRSLADKNFLEVLESSNLNIADGRGVLWAARYLTLPISGNRFLKSIQAIWQMVYSGAGIVLHPKSIAHPIPEAIPGVEAFKLMMKTAMDNKAGVFLFGSSDATLKLAAGNIKQEFPSLKISGTLNGYDFQKDNKIDVVGEINKTDAKVLIVALGSPKQEHWINDNINKLKNIRIAVGEGGTLDRIANPAQKSPKFINKIGLEWLWRTLFNKTKINRFRRFWNAVPAFIYQVVKWKIKNGQTKI
jgi:N-acetylglucosaminyldiphosphoundecaprenol N-acetyl-beta-D-mannosaminyltransferase